MFCEKCGKELEDGVKFCEHCGAPVAEDAGKIMPANAHTEFSGQTTEKKDSCATIKKIILFACAGNLLFPAFLYDFVQQLFGYNNRTNCDYRR